MSDLILHLGYPKTGTTTLQNSVFDVLHREKHIRYLGMGGFQDDATPARRDFFVALTNALYIEDENEFIAQVPKLRSAYDALVKALPGAGPVVLSNEHFLYSSWSSKQLNARIFPSRSAARLGQIFAGDQVSLVIGLRDLPDLIRSVYVQIRSNKSHVNHKLVAKTLDEYVECICKQDSFQSEMYHFEANIAHFQKAFPSAPIHKLQFDDFVSEQSQSVAGLVNFMGLPETALEVLAFPLEHSNAKIKTTNGTVVENIPPVLRPLARNNLLSPWLRHFTRSGPMKAIRNKLLPQDEIPNLTLRQRQEIEQVFELKQ